MSTSLKTTQEPANRPDVQTPVKYCPLFVAAFGGLYSGHSPDATAMNRGRVCLGEQCAWWTTAGGAGGCALRLLAESAYAGAQDVNALMSLGFQTCDDGAVRVTVL